MRWIVFFLVALNVFYFVWTQQQAPILSDGVGPFTLAGDITKDIRLVSEQVIDPLQIASITSDQGLCPHLGGYEHKDRAMLLEQRLLGMDISVKQVVISAEFSKDYWVYLPPFGSRDAALRQLKELEARGIDSYLVTQGDLGNGISLGIFSGQELAVGLLERMRAMGYGAELRELVRERREYWVRVLGSARALIGDELIEGLARDFPGLRRQMLPCEDLLASR